MTSQPSPLGGPPPAPDAHRAESGEAGAAPTKFPKVVVMGVSGSGKSTIGQLLAERAGVPFLDSDDLHPQANKEKMAAGEPLDDLDRKPWLELVAEFLRDSEVGMVAACSALKHSYRDALRIGDPDLVFVQLTGVRELITQRQHDRKNHFMPPALMQSQFDVLEPLRDDERGFPVDVAGDPDDVVDEILRRL
ncbi:gluconokinase [Frondihabitans cladoniiphilus]|uniref:Gluconokinase n=1 Tax=Frondihabitans cladoniiphilus TaxID=715785 RepID=A0ABP8VTP5_9MICO